MRLSFIPGDLHLHRSDDGRYHVILAGQKILECRSEKSAVAKFNELRKEMESRFPLRDLTVQEKEEILVQAIGESLVGHNSLGGRKKKTTAGSTRTFGG